MQVVIHIKKYSFQAFWQCRAHSAGYFPASFFQKHWEAWGAAGTWEVKQSRAMAADFKPQILVPDPAEGAMKKEGTKN